MTVLMGWSAVLMGFFGAYAQFQRVSTLGVVGVSLATWVLFVYLGCFWITYGFVAHSGEVVLGSAIILPLQLAILIRLRPWEHGRVAWRAFVFFAVCCLAPAVVWGWAGALYGTGVAMAINRAPQLIELVRHEDASGVSVGSWLFGFTGCSLWIGYYSGAHLWTPMAPTALAGLANLAIAMLAGWRHQQARRTEIVEEVFAF
jgi:uncharacterized protein with PQ loop repeat